MFVEGSQGVHRWGDGDGERDRHPFSISTLASSPVFGRYHHHNGRFGADDPIDRVARVAKARAGPH